LWVSVGGGHLATGDQVGGELVHRGAAVGDLLQLGIHQGYT
jgi:hypothetical protein